MTTALALQPRQIALVMQTIAVDCNPDKYADPVLKKRAAEDFNLFMEAARSYGLDPFRRQLLPLVFNKNDPEKRRMSIVVSRDGLRVIAQRCKDYRPASEPAQIVYDPALKGPTNPKGIVSATVRLWKQDNRGDWFPVVGEAYWDEFAPLTFPADAFDWIDTGETWPDSGKPKKRKVKRAGAEPTLDESGNWARMPIVMITKCAESQALRAGWPDQFGGLYAEEEMEQAVALDASDVVRREEERARLERIGGINTITMTWGDNWKLEQVPVGQMADRCAEFIRESAPDLVLKWSIANEEPLRQFWAAAPSDAFEVKRQIEAKLAALKSRDDAA